MTIRTTEVRPGQADGDLRPLRLGIAGFGRLAQTYYVPALQGLAGIGSIVVADPLTASRAAAERSLRNTGTCRTYADLLERELDGLIVASPPSTHLQIWNAAARLGLPVFMEKPFVLFGEMPQAESSAQVQRLLMVNFNRRFWPPYRRLRELVRNGGIGEPVSAVFALHVDLLSWCTVTAHRLQPGEGGALYDLGSQMLDLVAWCLGSELETMRVHVSSRRWEGDDVQLHLTLAGGIEVRCDLAYENRTFERVMVEGRQGRVRLEDPNMAVHLDDGAGSRRLLGRGKDFVTLGFRGVWRSRSMARFSIRASLSEFLQGIRQGQPCSPGFLDAVRNAAWLDAACESAKRGRAVTVGGAAEGGL